MDEKKKEIKDKQNEIDKGTKMYIDLLNASRQVEYVYPPSSGSSKKSNK